MLTGDNKLLLAPPGVPCLAPGKGVLFPFAPAVALAPAPTPAAAPPPDPLSLEGMASVVEEMTVLGVFDNSSVTSRSSDSKDHSASDSNTIDEGTRVFKRMFKLNPSPSGLLPLN